MATMPICSIRPSIDAKPPPSPPMKPLPNSMPSKPAPRKPANMPPRKPGRLKKPPAGDGVRRALPERAARLARLGHAAFNGSRTGRRCGRWRRGECLRAAAAEAAAAPRAGVGIADGEANTATSAQNASSGRKAKRDIDSSQETLRFDLTYWWTHGGDLKRCRMVSQTACGPAAGTLCGKIVPAPALVYRRRRLWSAQTREGSKPAR